MAPVRQAVKSRSEMQYSLRALLEYVTVCAVLMALAPTLGVAASIALMLLSLALWARQGPLALGMLAAASCAADWSPGSLHDGSAIGRQVAVLLLATALCLGYRLRRQWMDGTSRE